MSSLNQGINIHNVSKPTITMVQGNCPTGLWLNTPTFGLIVVFDDAKFEDPVVRITVTGIEILFNTYKMRDSKFTK